VARFGRIWEIAQRGARAQETAGARVAASSRMGAHAQAVGEAGGTVTFDFLAEWRRPACRSCRRTAENRPVPLPGQLSVREWGRREASAIGGRHDLAQRTRGRAREHATLAIEYARVPLGRELAWPQACTTCGCVSRAMARCACACSSLAASWAPSRPLAPAGGPCADSTPPWLARPPMCASRSPSTRPRAPPRLRRGGAQPVTSEAGSAVARPSRWRREWLLPLFCRLPLRRGCWLSRAARHRSRRIPILSRGRTLLGWIESCGKTCATDTWGVPFLAPRRRRVGRQSRNTRR